MDKMETLGEQLQKTLQAYGSYETMARVLRRCHPMFRGLNRQTVYRWYKEGDQMSSGAKGRISLALEILNSEPTPVAEDPRVERLQQLYTHLSELRWELKEVLKEFRASKRRV